MDFIVGVDIYLNDMSYFSDIMLPEACYLSADDVLPQVYIEPPHDRLAGHALDAGHDGSRWWSRTARLHGDLREIADRAGANEFFIPAVCGLYRVR